VFWYFRFRMTQHWDINQLLIKNQTLNPINPNQ